MFSKILKTIRQIPAVYTEILGVLESADQSVPRDEVTVARRVIRAIARPVLWAGRRLFAATMAVWTAVDLVIYTAVGFSWWIISAAGFIAAPVAVMFGMPRLWAWVWVGTAGLGALYVLMTVILLWKAVNSNYEPQTEVGQRFKNAHQTGSSPSDVFGGEAVPAAA